MRLALINYEYPPLGGGAGSATRAMAHCLARLGHQVTVITARFRGQPAKEMDQGALILRVPCRRDQKSESNPREMVSFLFSALRLAPALLADSPPHASLAFFGIPSGPIGWWLKRKLGAPYLVLLRGGDIPGFCPEQLSTYHKVLGPAIRAVWRGASAVVANSRGAQRLALDTGWGIPVEMIPNGVDTDFFHPPAEPQSSSMVRLLFAGRLSIQKGVDGLLEALYLLRKQDQERIWHLTLVGDGPLRSGLEERAARLGLAKRITFAGWLERDEVARAYRRADIFILPSLDEGMPNVLLEAMASGLPSIATSVPGSEELIRQNHNGLLVPPKSPEALCGALRELIADPSRRKRLGERAREDAEKRSWESVAREYADLVERCLKTKPR